MASFIRDADKSRHLSMIERLEPIKGKKLFAEKLSGLRSANLPVCLIFRMCRKRLSAKSHSLVAWNSLENAKFWNAHFLHWSWKNNEKIRNKMVTFFVGHGAKSKRPRKSRQTKVVRFEKFNPEILSRKNKFRFGSFPRREWEDERSQHVLLKSTLESSKGRWRRRASRGGGGRARSIALYNL